MINMDSYAYRSRLKHQDAVQKIFFAGLMMAICFWAGEILTSALIFVLMSSLTTYKGKIPLAVYSKALIIPAGFFLVGALSLLIDKAATSDLFLLAVPWGTGYIGIVTGAAQMVLKLLAQAVALVACLYFVAFNTPMIDLLSAGKRLKVPPLIIELLGLIYRFIFIILTEANVIFMAQRSRLGYSSLAQSFRSLGSLAATVFVRSYRRFDRLYTALEARGYEGTLNVLSEQRRASRLGFLPPLLWGTIFVMLTLWMRERS